MIDIQKACDQLNNAISEKKEGFLDVVNLIMNQIYQEGGELYWDRNIFIDYNGDEEKMRDLIRHSDKVLFRPTYDQEEHPGVTLWYKHSDKYYIGDMFREKDKNKKLFFRKTLNNENYQRKFIRQFKNGCREQVCSRRTTGDGYYNYRLYC